MKDETLRELERLFSKDKAAAPEPLPKLDGTSGPPLAGTTPPAEKPQRPGPDDDAQEPRGDDHEPYHD